MRKLGYVQQIVDDFYKSGDNIAVVAILDSAYANPNSCRCAYRGAIKKLGYNITTRMINGDLYLIRIQNPNWTAKNYKQACNKCLNRWPSKACATCASLSNFIDKEDNNHDKC